MRRRLWIGASILLCGCGPFAIGAGGAKLFATDTSDQRELNVALIREDATPAYVNLAEVTADLEATQRVVVETNKPALVDALLVGPGHLPTVGDTDASGCPLAFLDGAVARVFDGLTERGPDPSRFFATIRIAGTLDDGGYTLWVRARDSVAQTRCASISWTRDTLLPGIVPALAVEASVPRTLDLRWEAATDDGTGVAHYLVYWDAGGRNVPDTAARTPGRTYGFDVAGAAISGTASGPLPVVDTGFDLPGLLAGRAHYVQVTAVDRAGNETPLTSNEVALMTRAGGDGTFLPAAPSDTFAMGANPSFVVAADFNGDGVPDLAAVERGGDAVAYRLGGGGGTFGALRTHRVDGLTLLALAAADLDRDGYDDLVAVAPLHIQALLGGPDAALFGRGVRILVQQFGDLRPELHVGDMDADGVPDVVVGGQLAGDLGVLHAVYSRELGAQGYRGPDVFVATVRHFSANSIRMPRSADFNADNVSDVAFLDAASVRLLPLKPFDSFLALGPGLFQESVPYSAGAPPLASAVGDFNGDHIPDLAVGNSDRAIRVVAGVGSDGRGEGTLALQPPSAKIPGLPRQITCGDFNGDGIGDLAVAHEQPGGVAILLGEGEDGRPSGSFRVGQTIPSDEPPSAIAAHDLTGDGVVDLAISMEGAGTVRILRGRGARARATLDYTVSRIGASIASKAVATGDFDSDGVVDVALGVETTFFKAADILLTRSRNARGLAEFAGAVRFNGGLALACADFDNDGILDIAAQSDAETSVENNEAEPRLQILFGRGVNGRGEGSFEPTSGVFTSSFGKAAIALPAPCTTNPPATRPPAPEAIAVADFDGDGIPDVATLVELVKAGEPRRSAVALFRGKGAPGRGDKSFGVDAFYIVPCRGESLVAADLDGDLVTDLGVSSLEDRKVYIFPGRPRPVGGTESELGDGTFAATPGAIALDDLSIVQILAADFNRDGRNDLAVLHAAGIRLMLGYGRGGFRRGGEVALAPAPTQMASADLDLDDLPDLAAILSDNTLVIVRGGRDSDATPTLVRTVDLDGPASGIAFGDLSGDSIPDIVVGGGSVPRLLLGHGSVVGD